MQSKRKPRPWNPEATSAYWINRASRLLMRLHETRLRPLGFGMSQLPVLIALEEKGTLSQKVLAELAHVEQPTMAEMLGRMERDGVIRREPNPEDKRGSLSSLTSQSRARLPEAKEALLQGEDEATAGFTQQEKDLLRELLQRVVRNLETEG
ncbi:MarR family transcriptional regulator [Pyxidicoccus parkwayensis]|uniref:MarR family transcriptional regulator n=1 Tax=Pyxidicoccus parkwayensis TaxID=2813578 RepID=A0ABX7P807_9BACT|nr:MarR family transcriptional regulator [Pyxidicoccus parkwaysis]QSQ26547.1 MarR family transcriptional regulator [Pyxidicoccus parkwaysis]